MTEQPAVLIVDDDAVIRAVVRSGLARAADSYRVLEATDGAAAQAILLSEAIDVVITDLLMPGLSGLDLIRWANANDIAPVWIILSGVETFDAAVDAIQVGAFDFLAKPPGLPELEVSVRNALAHRRLVEERDELFGQLEAETAIIRRDLKRAEVIQRALLPARPPELDGYSVHALYCPGHHVGGDLYNVQCVGSRHLVLYVADATGHGVSSAMLSVLFYRRLVISDDDGNPLPPAEVLTRVNQALCAERVGAGLFLTAAYCVLDLETGDLQMAAAGHPPLVIAGADGTLRRMVRTGPVLGVSASAHYEERATRLRHDERMLFFTDGLLQHDEQAQWSAIESALAAGTTEGSALLQSLMDEVRTGGDDRDDITLLLLEAAARPSHFNNLASPAPDTTRLPPVAGSRGTVIWYGETSEASVLQVRGRGTWLDSDAFYDTARAVADDLRPVVIDLSLCDYLDSTFLGTIHELVSAHRVSVQGLKPAVHAIFEELDMRQVLQSAASPAIVLPADMQPLSNVATTSSSQTRMLRAHQLLSELSESNRAKFRDVVESLRAQPE